MAQPQKARNKERLLVCAVAVESNKLTFAVAMAVKKMKILHKFIDT
jgi:hypothetical protein